MITYRRFRYRIYPSPAQAAQLDRWSDALRWLWNLALEQHRIGHAHPRGYRVYHSAFDQQKQLTDLRAVAPWIDDVPRNVANRLLIDLEQAWKRCFNGTNREPQWKRKGRDTIGLTETHYQGWHLASSTLHFPKIGPICAVIHRPLVGKPKTCTVKRDVDQWFATVVCEIEIAEPVPSSKPPIGIDRGCVNLVADSNGRIVENPHHLRQAQHQLARAQRAASRRKKGSKNRDKARRRVARIHRTVRRRRNHVLHCESKRYANNHGTVFVEQLRIGNMSARGGFRKRGLNRSIMNAGWGRFADLIRYKMAPVGGVVIEVPAQWTSQKCSACGIVDTRNRASQSAFQCIHCDHEEHADTNAAKNILQRGITAVEPTVAVCGGLAETRRPVKQKRRVARRDTRSKQRPS